MSNLIVWCTTSDSGTCKKFPRHTYFIKQIFILNSYDIKENKFLVIVYFMLVNYIDLENIILKLQHITNWQTTSHLQIAGTPGVTMPRVAWHSWAWLMLYERLWTWAASLTGLCHHTALSNHHITCNTVMIIIPIHTLNEVWHWNSHTQIF
jgi:hypothetical protein